PRKFSTEHSPRRKAGSLPPSMRVCLPRAREYSHSPWRRGAGLPCGPPPRRRHRPPRAPGAVAPAVAHPARAGCRVAECRRTNATHRTAHAPARRTVRFPRRRAASLSEFAHQSNSCAFTIRIRSFNNQPFWEAPAGGASAAGLDPDGHHFASTLFKVVGNALIQGFQRTAIHVKVADHLSRQDLDRVDVISHEGDACARLHHDLANFLQLGLARHTAIIHPLVHAVELCSFHCADARPGGVVVRHNLLARPHDVQIQRIALVRLFGYEVTRLKLSVLRCREFLFRPESLLCGQRINLAQNLLQGGASESAVFGNVFDTLDCCLHGFAALSGYGHCCFT